MRRFRSWPQLALVVTLAVMNAGCVLIPEMKERVVELAVGGSTTAAFTSSGTLNTFDETNTVDVVGGLGFHLQSILTDAGIDVSQVTDIKVSGVDYRVTVPETGREIQHGVITLARNGSGSLPLISNFNASAGAVTDWQPAPLDPGGLAVAQINGMMNDILAALPNDPASNLTTITYHIGGDSVPADVATDFTWEIKIKLTITGKVKVSVPT